MSQSRGFLRQTTSCLYCLRFNPHRDLVPHRRASNRKDERPPRRLHCWIELNRLRHEFSPRNLQTRCFHAILNWALSGMCWFGRRRIRFPVENGNPYSPTNHYALALLNSSLWSPTVNYLETVFGCSSKHRRLSRSPVHGRGEHRWRHPKDRCQRVLPSLLRHVPWNQVQRIRQ